MTVPPAAAPASRPARKRRRKNRRILDHPRKPLELTLTGFAHGGKAVGRAPDGRVVFVEFAIPGERVLAEITSESPSFIEATTVEVLEASPHRVEAPCGYFGRCGGCQLQHIAYPEQLRLKTEVVRDQLVRIGRFNAPPVLEMTGMERPWGYRNHMRFTVRRDGGVGLMERGTHRFLRVEHCEIALDEVNRILARVQDATMQTRQLSVRAGEHTGELLVQPKLRWRPGRRRNVKSGQQHYSEELLGQQYRVSAAAFFQVNTRQAERLLELVVERVLAAEPRVVVDAYSGVGTLAALIAPSVEQVVTIETQPAAGDDAAVNLAEASNVTRLTGAAERLLPGLQPSPDVVVLDPPRAGVDGVVIDALAASTACRVVYVSCEPSTLARDLRLLAAHGFALREVQPVDMFPHTQHIECIATLDREPPAGP